MNDSLKKKSVGKLEIKGEVKMCLIKKNITRLVICFLLSFLMLHTVHAESYCSIENIIANTPERWVEEYNTKWRSISIDVEVEIPSVKVFPIVLVQRMPAVMKDKLSEYKGSIKNIDGSLGADKKKNDAVPPNCLPQNRYSYTHGQTPDQTPENVQISYDETMDYCYEEMERLWGLQKNDFRIDEVVIEDRAYYFSGKRDSITWGKPATDKGRYVITFVQNMHGIDVEAGKECYEYIDMKAENVFYTPYCFISLSDTQNTKIRAMLYQEMDMIYPDVPLISFESAKKTIEAEILAGHLRSVDVMKLCYIPYLDSKDKNIIWLLPAWYVKGVYTKDSKQELEMLTGDGVKYENMERHEVIVNAQNGKLLDYTDKRKDRRVVPKILTWKDVN